MDPIRKQRPLYALADPYLQFHYAILEPHRSALRSRDRRELWQQRLRDTFGSRVRGPVFEQQARTWVDRFAAAATIGGPADHVGPSTVSIDGVTERHLHHLQRARAAYGPRAANATLLLFGTDIDPGLAASDRHDVELVDLPRLYAGR